MHTTIIVVDNPKTFPLVLDKIKIVSSREYLTSPEFSGQNKATVYNLSSSYRYQTWGYYVSLLADARGHRVFPSASAIQDFKSQTIIRSISEELEQLFQTTLKDLKSDKFELSIYFSQNVNKKYQKLSKELYDLFQSPLLKATFAKHDGEWQIQNISPIALNAIPEEHKEYLLEFAKEYFAKNNVSKRQIARPFLDLAILVDPDEKQPPSDQQALDKFIKIADSMNIRAEFITKDDYDELSSYDALFIRTTTAVNHYTYKFSRFAQTEGMVVIDDPTSILRCTNKVYLNEILTQEKILTPETHIVYKKNLKQVVDILSYPCVLKKPDSSSSMGVSKADSKEEFLTKATDMLKESDVILVQKYMPTEFDWRVGVIDNKPFYTCRYFMAKNHWQIYNWEANKQEYAGDADNIPMYMVPKNVIDTALKATKPIGDGFYGVDIKVVDDKAYVIEVNDNPSIEFGYEDKILGDQLYVTILESFVQRYNKLSHIKSVII